ncbi:hypothetical protein N7474_005759 [Penicillium riverlandense]|uniref:uncharacterized protein n=1 Tax=Penicillium riverlandense TaxID=1903569 RepID=UPI0025492405|nr:uncharacterized protein N7474_005759 [Penicillium riverlandense]KAJ5820168.1 hypothetical protein N7474_005759 [Penicillium riverlandense]
MHPTRAVPPCETPDVSGLTATTTTTAAPSKDNGELRGFFGESSTIAFVSNMLGSPQYGPGVHLLNNDPEHGNPALQVPSTCDIHDKARSDRGASTFHLPDRHIADGIVDAYFERFHPIYPFLHEGIFRAEYEEMWSSLPDSPLRCSWYALLNIVFAHGCEFCDLAPKRGLPHVRPFVDRSRETMLSHIHQQSNLEFVQVLLLMSHYLQGTLELNECWNLVGLMIRTAVSIGLQLNPDNLHLTATEREIRKRVWWGCFIIDQTLSMKLGRPRALQLADAENVPYPSLIDDQYIHDRSPVSRQPVGRPSSIAFFRHTIELSKIIEKVLSHLYAARRVRERYVADPYESTIPEQHLILATVVRLDGELQAWWADVPVHLCGDTDAMEQRIFRRQQAVMKIRYLQIRLLIHRPLLLMVTQQDIGEDFLREAAVAGSKTCINAACRTVGLICAQYDNQLLHSLRYNLHYIFTSIGVLAHVQNVDRLGWVQMKGDADTNEIEYSLGHGMEFLRSAGRTNNLASKYASILERTLAETRETTDPEDDGRHNRTSRPLSPPSFNQSQRQGRNFSEPSQMPLQVPETYDILGYEDSVLGDWLSGDGLLEGAFSSDQFSGAFIL